MTDPVTFAVIKAGLDTIVDDMAYAVMRTARSPIVRDVLDYSATLCDAQGRILAQAKTVALHLGAVPDAMEVVLDRFGDDLHPGDVIVLNDPYAGGMHLPDIFMIRPVFAGARRLGFAVVIAHHCDMGGRVPGSNASDSTEIFQEGLRIPPIKLYDRGAPNRTLLALIATNVRLPDLVLGDLDAQYATCAIGERELLALHARHGDELEACFDRLLDYGEALTRKAIAAWPDGDYAFTDFIDGDGFSPDPIPIACRITVAGDQLAVDFAGSSPQVKGAINSTFSFVKSATYLAIRCALDHEVPNNAGVYRCIAVSAPGRLDPQPAPARRRGRPGADRLPRRRHRPRRPRPGRPRPPHGRGGGGQHRRRHRRLPGRTALRPRRHDQRRLGRPRRQGRHRGRDEPEPEHVEPAGRDARGALSAPRRGIRAPPRLRRRRPLARRARPRPPVPPPRRPRRPPAPLRPHLARPLGPLRRPVRGAARAASSTAAPAGSRFPARRPSRSRAGTVIRHEQAGAGGWGDPAGRDPAAVAADLADGKISPERAEADYGARA